MSTPEVGPYIRGLEFRQRIGAGGYADVFRYHETSLDRDVAVKVVREAGLSEQEASGFVAEAHAMAHLAHPHIVPVFSVGRTAHGRPYLTMPYYPDGTLSDRAQRPLDVAEVLKTGVQIGSAVAYAHGAGILHRDIKPHNILRNQFGPALSDFGIAATIADVTERSIGVSIPWSPPEVLRDSAPPSVASDVYSLAATLWHLLAAHSPYDQAGFVSAGEPNPAGGVGGRPPSPPADDTEAALVRRILLEPVPPLGRRDVPATLEQLLRQSMAKDPGDRFSAMTSFVLALQDVQRQLRLEPTDVVLVPGRRRQPIRLSQEDEALGGGSVHPGATRRRLEREPAVGAVRATPAEQEQTGGQEVQPSEPALTTAGASPREGTAPGRTRTLVLLVLVLVMLAVLLLGVLMLALGPT